MVGQANNVYCFPGIGLGGIVAEAHEMTDAMFMSAADTLASMVSRARQDEGGLYPPLSDLRAVSRAIAVAVVREARDSGFGRAFRDEEIEPAVDAAMWFPEYVPYVPA